MTELTGEWQQDADRLAAASIAGGSPTGWFEQLYAAGDAGRTTMPWDRAEPNPLLVESLEQPRSGGATRAGRRALVVGSGLGADAAYLARNGWDTVGFDISETAARLAGERYGRTGLRFVQADLLDPPPEFDRAFDLVVEIYTVQALPDPPRRQAIANVSELVADGGRLLVVAFAGDVAADPADGPPWPIAREELDLFAAGRLDAAAVDRRVDAGGVSRWIAWFTAPPAAGG